PPRDDKLPMARNPAKANRLRTLPDMLNWYETDAERWSLNLLQKVALLSQHIKKHNPEAKLLFFT
ncbi:hypothetical protein OFC10_33030, partial [Escherichia coli]|nr:hypothetical protein [Escherichia coli]